MRITIALLSIFCSTTLMCCDSTTKTTTVKSPDGTVTTTVKTTKKVDAKALDSSAQIAGDAATVYLQSKSTP